MLLRPFLIFGTNTEKIVYFQLDFSFKTTTCKCTGQIAKLVHSDILTEG